MGEREILSQLLRELYPAVKKLNVHKLREISKKALEYGAINNSKLFVELAVIAHALSKITAKEYYRKVPELWSKFLEDLSSFIKEPPEKSIAKVGESIEKIDRALGRYVEGLLHRSRVRVGTTLYAWGMSVGTASELSGATEAEILRQAGVTKIVDEDGISSEISKKLKEVEKLL